MSAFLKRKTCSIVLIVLYRAIRCLARKDSRIRHEFESFDDQFTIKISLTESAGPSIILRKDKNTLIRLRESAHSDLFLKFKSVDAAFLVFTGMMGISRAYSEHRMSVKGDIGDTMKLVRIIDIVEAYLFPRFMTKRILRSIPLKEMSSLSVYRMVLLGF